MKQTATTQSTVEDTSVSILVDGKLTHLEYDEMKSFHKGDSWFGCTVGFRAMQMAAREFSKSTLAKQTIWSRENLSIVSAHPGPGVKDAIELITGAISANRFQLHDSINTQDGNSVCNSSMRFEWWVNSNGNTIHIKLHDDIVPESFLPLLDRINADDYLNDNEKNKDRKKFDQMKQELSNTVWSQSLDACFDISHVTSTNSEVSKQC